MGLINKYLNWNKRFFLREKPFIKHFHKYYSIQIEKFKQERHLRFFSFDIDASWKTHHGGFGIEFCILGIYFIFKTYDNRHWCYKCEKYADEICYQEKHKKITWE